MSLLDYFRLSKPKSAPLAKERLQILVAHERSYRNQPSWLPQLQQELLDVIGKYVNVDQNVKVDDHAGDKLAARRLAGTLAAAEIRRTL